MSGYCPDCGNTQCICDEIKSGISLDDEMIRLKQRIAELEKKLADSDCTIELMLPTAQRLKELETAVQEVIDIYDRRKHPFSAFVYFGDEEINELRTVLKGGEAI